MNDIYSKIPRKTRKRGYIALLEKRIKELEIIAAKFGCYEDEKPIICLHCPYADGCTEKYNEIL